MTTKSKSNPSPNPIYSYANMIKTLIAHKNKQQSIKQPIEISDWTALSRRSIFGTIREEVYFEGIALWFSWIFTRVSLYTLLEYDVIRHAPLSVVMDAGSRIVNFIRDGTAFG